MPWSSLDEVPDQVKEHKGIPLTLKQANKWGEIFDALKAQGDVTNAAAVAWSTWGKIYEEQNGKWVIRDQVNMSKELATEDLKAVEVFKVGEWNGHNITEEDINDIVAAHKEIGDLIKPYIKLGHNNKQQLLASDGWPAGGWISKVYKKSKTLFIDIKEMPRALAKLVKAGAWKRVSAEIFRDYIVTRHETVDKSSKVYRRVLGAVAFLGADLPAVTTLSDILAWYNDDKAVLAWYSRDDSQIITDVIEFNKEEEFEMDPKELEKFTKNINEQMEALKVSQEAFTKTQEELTAKQEDFNKKQEEFATKQTEFETKEKELAEKSEKYEKLDEVLETLENVEDIAEFITDTANEKKDTLEKKELYEKELEKARKTDVDSYVEKLTKESKLVPAQKSLATELLYAVQLQPATIKFSKEIAETIKVKEEMSLFETVKAFMNSLPDRKILEQFTRKDEFKSGDVDGDRRTLVKEYQEKHKCDYAKAQIAVKKARPDLFETDDSE